MSGMRTILVPVDFSEGSRAAAREAARIARTTKSAICLLHAAAGTQAIDWAKELATNGCGSLQALHQLAAFIVAERLDPLTTTGLVRMGSVAQVIIEYAHEVRPELIVIGPVLRTGTVGINTQRRYIIAIDHCHVQTPMEHSAARLAPRLMMTAEATKGNPRARSA